ncbi:MAG: SDR family oxidoreductase [Verrucomicrobiota bacterium]
MTTRASHLQDPRTRFPAPPYGSTDQSHPGHENEMIPQAHHGEDTYVGHGRLEGLVALISGGDSGIGRAVALAYAREGADVAFTYLEEEDDARETERLVQEAGREVISYKSDQTDRAACEKVVADTLERFGRLDILVNNAAYQQTYSKIEDIPDDELRRAFETNIEAFFYLSRAALGHLPPGGSIINRTSIQAYDPSPALAPYAATKAAIANFTLSLARMAAERGVRVNAVAPGPVWTPLIPATLPDESARAFGASTLWKRAAQPAELAPLYVFLASNDASFISGEIYGAVGGRKQV